MARLLPLFWVEDRWHLDFPLTSWFCSNQEGRECALLIGGPLWRRAANSAPHLLAMLTSFGILGSAPNLSLVHFQCDYMLPSRFPNRSLWIGESPGRILSTHDDLYVDLPSKPTYLQVFASTIREFWRASLLVIPFQPRCNLLEKNESPNLQ